MFSYFIVLSVIALSSVYSNPLPQSYADTGREFKLAKPSSDVDMSYWQDLATKTAIITAKCGSENFVARCCNSKLVDAHASRLQQPLNLYGQVMDSVGILDCGGNYDRTNAACSQMGDSPTCCADVDTNFELVKLLRNGDPKYLQKRYHLTCAVNLAGYTTKPNNVPNSEANNGLNNEPTMYKLHISVDQYPSGNPQPGAEPAPPENRLPLPLEDEKQLTEPSKLKSDKKPVPTFILDEGD